MNAFFADLCFSIYKVSISKNENKTSRVRELNTLLRDRLCIRNDLNEVRMLEPCMQEVVFLSDSSPFLLLSRVPKVWDGELRSSEDGGLSNRFHK